MSERLPPPMRPPDTAEQEKRESAAKQLRTSYGFVFGGEHGKLVLADLMANFGFEDDGIEKPSAIPNIRSEEVWLREGAKQPIRHILRRMRDASAKPKPKKKKETATHE